MNQMIILSPGPGDMTDEIQDAIDRAHESCGAVFFAPGVYEIGHSKYKTDDYCTMHALRVYSDMILTGANAVIRVTDPGISHTIFTHNDDDATGYDGAHDIRISGFTFDGGASRCLTQVNVSHARHVVIEDCNFVNGARWHDIEINSSENVTVTRCAFYPHKRGLYEEPIQIRSEQIQLDSAIGAGNLAVCDGTVCRNILIDNCLFDGGDHPAIGNHSHTAHHNIRISRCTFRTDSDYPRGYISFNYEAAPDVHLVSVTDCVFYKARGGVEIKNGRCDSTVSGCKFFGVERPVWNEGTVLETGNLFFEEEA